jgi:MarR family transcriptional regulator, organic hydroperoxide resistance regulator
MTSEKTLIVDHCLYFTANAFARAITRIADEEFSITGISPSHAFLVMRVNEKPGLTQKELAELLKLAPSTVTRFLDDLERKGYVGRTVEGKISRIQLTESGRQLQSKIDVAWCNLYNRYSKILGEEDGHTLSKMLQTAIQKLGE